MIEIFAYFIAIVASSLSCLVIEGIVSWPHFETACYHTRLGSLPCDDRLRDLISFDSYLFVLVLIAAVLTTAIPSFLTIRILDLIKAKSIGYFMFAGLVIAAVSCFIFTVAGRYLFSDGDAPRPFIESYLLIARTAMPSGLVGGCVYWFVIRVSKTLWPDHHPLKKARVVVIDETQS